MKHIKESKKPVAENVRKELESKKLVKEGAGAGYTVRIKDLKFGKILDKKYIEQKKKYESYHECKVEILPGEYEIEAEDYYNDFFWQEHEIGDSAYAKIDGGVATISYSCNSYEEDEADDELHRELENMEMDIAFDYGAGWVHADLPTDKPIESDHVSVEGREFYGSIDKIELNAPDLADAVNGGHQSIYDRDEEEEEENLDDENEEYNESSIEDNNEEDDAVGDGEWHVFDFGSDFDFYERYTVIAPDGYVFFIGSDGGVGSFEGERLSYSTSDEMCDALATKDRQGNEVVPSELELSPDGISHDRIVSRGLTRIKDKYDYDDELVNESYNDEWAEVGAAFDEFRQRLWKYTRQDRENRMEFFQDCMNKCEDAFREYHDACVADDW